MASCPKKKNLSNFIATWTSFACSFQEHGFVNI